MYFKIFANNLKKKRSGNKINIKVGNLNNLRDFSHVEDVVNALIKISIKGLPGESYIISSNQLTKVAKIINIIETFFNKKIILKKDKKLLRTFDEKYILGSNKKIRKIGWTPKKKFKDIVLDTINNE